MNSQFLFLLSFLIPLSTSSLERITCRNRQILIPSGRFFSSELIEVEKLPNIGKLEKDIINEECKALRSSRSKRGLFGFLKKALSAGRRVKAQKVITMAQGAQVAYSYLSWRNSKASGASGAQDPLLSLISFRDYVKILIRNSYEEVLEEQNVQNATSYKSTSISVVKCVLHDSNSFSLQYRTLITDKIKVEAKRCEDNGVLDVGERIYEFYEFSKLYTVERDGMVLEVNGSKCVKHGEKETEILSCPESALSPFHCSPKHLKKCHLKQLSTNSEIKRKVFNGLVYIGMAKRITWSEAGWDFKLTKNPNLGKVAIHLPYKYMEIAKDFEDIQYIY